MRRRIALLLFIVLATVSSFSTAQATHLIPTPPDVAGHWAGPVIRDHIARGVVAGDDSTLFHPNQVVTRGEFVTWLVDTLELPRYPAAIPDFLDVIGHPSHWLGFLPGAVAAGLVRLADYADQRFQPDELLSRLDLAVLIVRAIGQESRARQDIALPVPFTDPIPEWANGYLRTVASLGILVGYPDGTFRPQQPATRAEALVALQFARRLRLGEGPQGGPQGGSGAFPARHLEILTIRAGEKTTIAPGYWMQSGNASAPLFPLLALVTALGGQYLAHPEGILVFSCNRALIIDWEEPTRVPDITVPPQPTPEPTEADLLRPRWPVRTARLTFAPRLNAPVENLSPVAGLEGIWQLNGLAVVSPGLLREALDAKVEWKYPAEVRVDGCGGSLASPFREP